MKTDVYSFKKGEDELDAVTDEAAKIASYNGLSKNDSLKLTLLSEELVGMLPNLLIYGSGKFWIENKGDEYQIHTVVEPDTMLPSVVRDRILSVSKTGLNAAAVGIMSKIRISAERMLADYAARSGTAGIEYPDEGFEFYDMGEYSDPLEYSNAWSLAKYRSEAIKNGEAWDELEKSIIAKMADDVIVGIIGGKVEIVVKKSFKKEE